MVKPQLGHDQVVSEWRWSLNIQAVTRAGFTVSLRCMIVRTYNICDPVQENRPQRGNLNN